MALELAIRFGKSSSKNYANALRLAKKFSNFTPVSESHAYNELLVTASELAAHHQRVRSLWDLVKNWMSSAVLLDGEEVRFQEIEPYLRVLQCGREYHRAVLPEVHCNLEKDKPGWGCHFLRTVNPYLPENSWDWQRGTFWFQFGSFENPTLWKIDKKTLRGTLAREVEVRRLGMCPIFSSERVEEAISSLPDEINLDTAEEWEIDYRVSPLGELAERVAKGVRPKSISEGHDLQYGLRIDLDPLAGEESNDEPEPSDPARQVPTVTFHDIGGIEDILQTIREVIELPLKRPELFRHLAIRPHKGILLYGPPGCGKTLVAKAIANEVGAHFLSVAGPELLSKWFGQSEENLRSVFEQARQLQPSIIYFDEIDAIAQTRSAEETARGEARVVNQLLTLMDGFDDYGNVCVIASTNREELVDEALLRPGRFDYSLEVKKPTREGCRRILEIHCRDMPLDPEFDLKDFGDKLLGLSGAEIAFVAREAAYNCLRGKLDLAALVQGEATEGPDLESLVVTEWDFRRALEAIKKVPRE